MPQTVIISQVLEEAHHLTPRHPQPCHRSHLLPLPTLPLLCSAQLPDPDWMMTSLF